MGFRTTIKLANQAAITTIAKTGNNLTYTFSANTTVPSGAGYLLVFTKNAEGEMSTGVSVAISDYGAALFDVGKFYVDIMGV